MVKSINRIRKASFALIFSFSRNGCKKSDVLHFPFNQAIVDCSKSGHFMLSDFSNFKFCYFQFRLVKWIQLLENFSWWIVDKTIEPPFISFECLIERVCWTISIPSTLHSVNIPNYRLHFIVASLYSLDSSINIDISDLELQLKFALFFSVKLVRIFLILRR